MAGSAETPATDGGALASLSLFLLLLAAFVLLTAGARFETERVEQVVSGMQRAFDAEAQFTVDPALVVAGAPPVSARAGSVLAPGEFRATLVRLFATEFPVGRMAELKPGRIMQVTLPADALFDREGAVLAGRVGLLDRLAAALRAAPEGLAYEATLRLGLPGDADAAARAMAHRRAAAFAEAAIRQGVPAGALRAGFEPGAADTLRLVFAIREAAAAGEGADAP
ncbi:MAG TPA: hypothetical protein VEH84_01560 [Alphaproteobacteria bacterium]|nr:hypothetical protein [Alphaproteobacteria bacterium]